MLGPHCARNEGQAKATWQLGALLPTPQCTLLPITHSLCQLLISHSSILALPVTLCAGPGPLAEPQQLI